MNETYNSVVQRLSDHEYHLHSIVVSCTSIDAALEGLWMDARFNPTIMEVSQVDHDTLLADVNRNRCCLTRVGEEHDLDSRLDVYINQDTGVVIQVLIRDLPQGTVKLWAEPKE